MVCMAQVTEGACQKSLEGVDTLQAVEAPCSVSNGPVKISLKTSVNGGLIRKKNTGLQVEVGLSLHLVRFVGTGSHIAIR